VHPEGHVAQKKHKLASGTLGARGAKRTRRVAPLEHVVHPEGHVALSLMKEQT
jgi:hypothetical protein